MNQSEDAKELKRHVVTFRCPPSLLAALQKASDRDMNSIADIVRRAVSHHMRSNGLLA
jgi:hypothetical protein